MSESEPERCSIPTGIGVVAKRLNDRLAGRRQYLHYDAAGAWLLIDLAKAKTLTQPQLEALAAETGAIGTNEVIVYPRGFPG
jgi:hypothetical protein